jgi:putative ABC transport system permease protein
VRDREQVLANGLNWNTQVMGESPDYPQIRNWDMASGSMFSDQDVRSLAKSAVIGKTVVDQLFPNENPVGQTIRIRNLPFLVVGELASKGFNLFGQDQDDVVIVPYTSHMHRITTRIFVNDILVEAANDKVIDRSKTISRFAADAASQQRTGFHRAQSAGTHASWSRPRRARWVFCSRASPPFRSLSAASAS